MPVAIELILHIIFTSVQITEDFNEYLIMFMTSHINAN